MYPTDDEKIVIAEAEQLMTAKMADYDPSHDTYHVHRVRKTAMAIARELKPSSLDLLVVEIAALLHDVLDKKYVSEELHSDPYAFFLPFFQSIKSKCANLDLVQDGRAKQIVRIIEHVSWSTEKKLRESGQWGQWHEECAELHCVQDADRLDAIGAFGILRCAAYNSSRNNPLHTPPGDSALPDSAIQHFYDKLIHVSGRLKTAPGQRLGDQRHRLLVDFLASVDKEYEVAFP